MVGCAFDAPVEYALLVELEPVIDVYGACDRALSQGFLHFGTAGDVNVSGNLVRASGVCAFLLVASVWVLLLSYETVLGCEIKSMIFKPTITPLRALFLAINELLF
jgi:hypothetical protein